MVLKLLLFLNQYREPYFFQITSGMEPPYIKKINGMKLVEMRAWNLDPAYSAWATWGLNLPFFAQDVL